MRHQLAPTRQTHGVDAVGLEGLNGDISPHGDNHQRHEQPVAARELRNEEDARQGRVHHTAHHAAHAQHGEVALGDVEAEGVVAIPYNGEDEARDAAQEERGREDTAATAAAVGRRRGKHLGKHHQKEVEQKKLAVAVEERSVERLLPIVHALAVEQQFDEVVAFTVEHREEEDEHAEHRSAHQEAQTARAQAAEDLALHPVHHAREVEGQQTADDAQQDVGRRARHGEGVLQLEAEDGFGAGEDEDNAGGCDTTHQKRQQGGHREVDHQHLEHEDKTRDGRLENTGNRCCCTAAHKDHHLFAREAEETSQVGSYGAAREHDRGLGADTAAEADGDGRSHDGTPTVVGLDETLLACNGEKDACDAVTDVIPYDVAHKEAREHDADDGIDEVEPVGVGDGVTLSDKKLNLLNDKLQHHAGQRCTDTHKESQKKHEAAVATVATAPKQDMVEQPPHGRNTLNSPSALRRMICEGRAGLVSFWRERIT